MNQMIMALILIVSSCTGEAQLPKAFSEQLYESKKDIKPLIISDILGQKGVDLFKRLVTSGDLFALLLALDREVPDVSEEARYVALLNEVHLANQTLSELLVELRKNNRMLGRTIIQEGAQDG
ncbi:MAG: hypothetical protein Q8L68_04725 [Methylococcales bacterium]|nr:hypothetical protein [Methylococcales bacterium]